MRRLALAACVLALCVLAGVPASAGARRAVPQGFVGMMVEGPTLDPRIANLGSEMDIMVRSGVESVRMVFPWADEQPYPTFQSVPAGQQARYRDENGVPTDFDYTDRVVALAASRHLTVLPVIWHAPDWAAREPGDQASPPSSPEALGRYSAALVSRYGPNGSLWAQDPSLPKMPIRRWQIWNEPNIIAFWKDQPFAADYVSDLRAASTAIRGVDPGAQIVLAGLTNASWTALQEVYAAGGKGLFDIVAAHPFTKQVRGVVTILRKIRAVMARNGDGAKPLMVTELSWPSALGKIKSRYLKGFEVTPRQQAQRVRDAYALLAKWRRRLRIIQVDWYTWLRYDSFRIESFDYAGLRHLSYPGYKKTDKPALGAFKSEVLKLEGCRRKGPLATDCRR